MKFFALLIFLLPCISSAQQRSTYSFSLGGGAIWKQNIRNDNQYDKSDENTELRAIPMARIKIGPLEIAGPNIKLKLPRYKFIAPYISLKRSGERYYGPGMDWRKDSWFGEAGLNIMMFKLSYSKDIQGRSSGEIFSISYSGRYFLGPVMLSYTLSHNFLDREFSNYYYGVRSHEVTSTRNYYSPSSGGATSVALSPIWIINKNWSLFNSVKHTFLGSKVKNSPTVARDSYLTIVSGLTYKFN